MEVQASAAATAKGPSPIVFSALTQNVDIWSMPIDAKTGTASGGEMQRITNALTLDAWPSISHDGRRMVF